MSFDALRNWMLGRPKDERQFFDLLTTGVWITDAAHPGEEPLSMEAPS